MRRELTSETLQVIKRTLSEKLVICNRRYYFLVHPKFICLLLFLWPILDFTLFLHAGVQITFTWLLVFPKTLTVIHSEVSVPNGYFYLIEVSYNVVSVTSEGNLDWCTLLRMKDYHLFFQLTEQIEILHFGRWQTPVKHKELS